jgi:hypothetical protein
MEGFMRCIPCFAVMSVADREWVAARQQTVAFLKENGLTPDGDTPPGMVESALTYLCSIPCRQNNGIIRYVHLFQFHPQLVTKPTYFHVVASPGWWPEVCRSLPPRHRTSGRAPLRLVS